jgi:phosphoglycolate phosphatase
MAPSYRHVVWDWNGTLLDDVDIVVDVMNTLLRRRGLPTLGHERYRELFCFPVRDYYAAVGLDLEREPFADLAAEWVAGFQGRWREARIRKDANIVIESLTGRGLSHSVLSAAERSLLREQVNHFGVASYFADLVGIDDHHAEGKVAAGRAWLAAQGFDTNEVLLVGDTDHDYEVGVALGVDVVLIDDGHQSRTRLERCGVPVVNSLFDLADFEGL